MVENKTIKQDINKIPVFKTPKEKFIFLYGDCIGTRAYEKFRGLIEKYKNKMENKNYCLSEKDIVLISYGDQLLDRTEKPLKVLKKFADKFLYKKINTIHILPFYPYSSDDGFSVIDYTSVDSNLGSWSDIQDLSQGYRLMFDAVINHISVKSRWFKEYLNGNPKYENYFISVDPKADLRAVVRPREHSLLTPFKTKNGLKHLWTTFSADQVDLNYSNPDVLISVTEVLLEYLFRGANIIRLDAVGFLWKEVGTTSIHLPQTHTVVKLFRDLIDEISPGAILITETNVPHEENISYFGSGEDEANMVYNFSLSPLIVHGILNNSAKILTKWAKMFEPCSMKNFFFNFTASHDGIGLRPLAGLIPDEEIQEIASAAKSRGGYVSYKKNSDGTQSPYELNITYFDMVSHFSDSSDIKIKKFILSQAIALAMPGVPGIYFHSLIGSQNYHQGIEKTGMYRSINREKLYLSSLQEDLKNMQTIRSQIFYNYLKLIDIRINEIAFHPRAHSAFLELHPAVFCILRVSTDEKSKVLALHNLSDTQVEVQLPKTIKNNLLEDLVTSNKVNGFNLELEPYCVKWIKVC